MDAWEGYHSVPIDKDDRHYTTFLTQWGRFRYKTSPQGFVAAGDGYCHRFDEVTRDVPNQKHCVDDSILYEYTLKELFFAVCNYLTLCGNAGILMTKPKFIFGRKRIEFVGFKLTEDSVEPSRILLVLEAGLD